MQSVSAASSVPIGPKKRNQLAQLPAPKPVDYFVPQMPSEMIDEISKVKQELLRRRVSISRRPERNIGDDALEDSVCEEYKANFKEEEERRKNVNNSSFFSISRMFDFSAEQKAEVDEDYIKAYQFVSETIDSLSKKDYKQNREF